MARERLLKWFLLLGTGVVLFSPAIGRAAGLGGGGVQATAIVNGRLVHVGPGSVVGVGERHGGLCSLGHPIQVMGRVPDDSGPAAAEIRIHVNQDCQFIVQSVRMLKNPPTSPSEAKDRSTQATIRDRRGRSSLRLDPDSPVNHYGWAKERVEEYVNIVVTYTYTEMKYTRNGGSVYNGNSGSCAFWQDGGGWTVTFEGCIISGQGPSQVYVWGQYHFSSSIPPRPSYSLYAKFGANPGPYFTGLVKNGNVPMGWDAIYSGGIYY
jgi:hypothetical protein